MELPEYGAQLTSEQADEYFRGAKKALEDAQRKPHRNLWGRFRGHLDPKHQERLAESIGIILRLSSTPVVWQDQTEEAKIENIGNLFNEVGMFMSKFKNTGVRILYGPPDLF